ncbi:hypothetical protein [Pseudodesulfovibrio sediminis]|uniref:Uncharacterized protein n=1 Tax=Pseudodesulfovibrio sediminis TaxID=2810563 RepID=A0ABM7PA64_9BACT|nr:hypothetical protein [Pseudodesulfovibrio sediminis]BCS89955.1 hypothetical protein PSDVSF_31970 [Pseudodesulfovibrio sediminis]
MPWTDITFTTPQPLQAVHEGLQDCHAVAPGELDNSTARLNAVKGSVAISTNPVATTASGVAALRTSMEGLLQAGGRFVCVHPYIHPLGDRRGDYAYLTPQQAAEGMAAKLADPMDSPGEDTLQAVLLMLRGVEHTDFVETLNAFNTVFPVSELQLAERRAGQLATLEQDKMIQTTGPVHPAWRGQDPRRHERAKDMGTTLGAQVALGEGYAIEAVRPEDELAALIDKKKALLEQLETDWTTLQDVIQGGAGKGLVLNGNSGSIHRQLVELRPPVEGYKLAAVCAWIGTAEHMTFFRELLGI